MKRRYYVGIKSSSRAVFSSSKTPTSERYSGEYLAVIGPFKTKRAALFMARHGGNNPHLRCVTDAERIARIESEEVTS